ncbi:MAG: amidohydrolase, partial [Chloroflexi bacterium]|nr:amidohydrolase [Chloroflexota bacterium]
MRNGKKVYDTDTHVRPVAELWNEYLPKPTREVLQASYLTPVKLNVSGEPMEGPLVHRYVVEQAEGWSSAKPRALGQAEAGESAKREWQRFMGDKWPAADAEWNAAGRLRDMDEEGVDVQAMVSDYPRSVSHPELDLEFMRANHRLLSDFCGTAPGRLKAFMVLDARFLDESVRQIKEWGSERWVAGMRVMLPLDFPLDHPDLEPLWAAANEAGLCVVHHSASNGYPGYRDLWGNPFLGRLASHPWGAMRAMAAFIGCGALDRYPNLRFAILESGFGWLPFWAIRMQDQMDYIGYVAPLRHTVAEYLAGGRFFASVVLHEGPQMIRNVTDALGPGILMFSSDYPHPESRFPRSVDVMLEWGLDEDLLDAMLWRNPVACFGE